MKRNTLLLLLAIGSAVPLSAQDPGFRLGLKVSPNFAWMRADSKDLESDGNRMGFSFGLLGDLPIGDQGTYFLSTGVLLTNMGGKFKADATYEIDGVSTAVKSEQDLKLKYVEIPVTLKLRTTTESAMNFYAQVGMSAGLNVRARTDLTTSSTANGVTTTVSSEDEDVLDDMAFFRAGLIIGAGIEYKVGGTACAFGGLTYNNGITNALDGNAKKLLAGDKKSKLFADYLEITLGIFL